MDLIFAEFATSSKSLKMHTAKIRHFNKSPLTTLQIVKIGLSEQPTHLPGVIFAKIAGCENIPIYGTMIILITALYVKSSMELKLVLIIYMYLKNFGHVMGILCNGVHVLHPFLLTLIIAKNLLNKGYWCDRFVIWNLVSDKHCISDPKWFALRHVGSDDRAFLKVSFSICQFEDKFWHIFQHLTILCKMGSLDLEI